jgi:hypothetical protein
MKVFAIVMCVCLVGATAASGAYSTGFESIVASPAGTVLTGQDGYYIPSGTTSVDFLAYTYAGNALGLPANPTGGLQFVGGTGPANSTYARAQRDVDFSGNSVWTIAYDFCATYMGSGVSANNIGSFSVQNGVATGVYINLMAWIDPNVPTTYNASFLPYDSGGVQFAQPGVTPGPAWEGLEINHWYHNHTVIDLVSNVIMEVVIVDLETMQESVYYPSGWYLEGGTAGLTYPPFGFRFFGGGGVAGNTLAFDNMSVSPGVSAVEMTSWGAIKASFR